MKHPRTISLSVWPLLMAALLQVPSPGTYGAESAGETNQAEGDVKACKEQLNRIREAVQRYQATYQRMPNWFLDLHPDFIDDPKIFICPVVRRLGDLRSWRAGVRSEVFWDPVLPTSYSYEFSAKELPLAPGVHPTYQEYKIRQMALVGNQVPLVRCFAHDKILNLPVEGRVYPSGLYWENELTHRPPNEPTGHEKLEGHRVFQDLLTAYLSKPRTYPPRDQRANQQLLDLAGSYNFGLNETFNSSGGEGDFANLPQGVVKLQRANAPFDIRGRIQLRAKESNLPFPVRVNGIKVDQACRSIHFLCGTTGKEDSGSEVGSFEVRYSDGRSNRIPIHYGKPVRGWWFDPKTPQPEDARVWEGPSQFSLSQGKRHVRIYDLRWDNPLPDVRIATLDFVSALTDSAPFLLAITLE